MALARVAVAIPTLVNHGLLNRCLSSVVAQLDVQVDLLLIENGPQAAEGCLEWEARGASVYRPGRNIGVAASWNTACQWAWDRGHTRVVLLNDDLALTLRTTLIRLVIAARDEPRAVFALAGRGFACVCLTRMVWDEIGAFDEGFWPAYYEDNDMARRVRLAGFACRDLDVPSEHFGSATIRTDPAMDALNRTAFPLNQTRYIAKWGGLPEREVFDQPWNGGPAWPPVADLLAQPA